MYQERMFETWKKGLLHLVIVIALPIIPVIIYMFTECVSNSYLYVLLLTVIGSFLYEFMNLSNSNCNVVLKIESIICSVFLIIMLIWDLFSLLFTYSGENNTGVPIKTSDYVLVSLFIIPVIVVIIEIIRSIIYDIKASQFTPTEKNLVKGAATV